MPDNHKEDSCNCGHHHHEHHEHEHHDDHSCDCGHHHHEHHEHEHHDNHSCDCGHHHEHKHHEHAVPANANQKHVYILENLGCAHCAAKMEEKINELPGVTSASITFATKQLRIEADRPEELFSEIQKICTSIESQVKVIPKSIKNKTASQQSHHTEESHNSNETSHATHTHSYKDSSEQKDLLQISLGAVFFIIGLILHHKGIDTIPAFAVFVIGYLILGGKILLEAARNISHGQIFDENFLMCIATIGAFAIHEYPEALGVMLFYRVGELFEHKAVEKSRSQIMDAIDMRPEVVNLVIDDEIKTIPAENARVKDILLIRPGDRIPLDGIVVEGESRIDTSPITGEPVPVSVKTGSRIISGCLNTSGQLKICVEKTLEESMVSRILDSVENAAASKPKIDRFITRFAKVYTPVVITAAAATAILPSIASGNWNYWIYTALTFLVMSCPCALVLSVPLAFYSGIGAGSKKGILFKGGVSIEALNNLKAVVMDKTGTITEGNFRLQKIVSCTSQKSAHISYTEEELLRICASCEQTSTHPIAHSIVTAAQEKGIVLEQTLSMEEISGFGISAKLPEGDILCGNKKLMDKYHVTISEMPQDSYGAEVFLAINGTMAGYFLISDTIKKDAKSAIQRLKSFGLHTSMLTGDSESSAKAVAEETGIDEVYAKLLPQDKLTALTKIRAKHGAVMFVGDGINDAPVLAGADVGAAMGSGADAAIEAADAVFMTSNVDSIPEAIAIAKGTNRIAIQNVVFALAIKIAVMILGLCGYANMWMAVFADTGVAMICVLNSIRILYKK